MLIDIKLGSFTKLDYYAARKLTLKDLKSCLAAQLHLACSFVTAFC